MRALSRAGRALIVALAGAVPTLAAVIFVAFSLMALAPGDAVDSITAEMGSVSPEAAARMRSQLGLDQGFWTRLVHYVSGLLHGDFGYSPIYNLPVSRLVFERLPASIALAGGAMLLALVLGTAIGLAMAARPGSLIDRALGGLLLLFYSIPGFWTGLMLIVLFSVWLGWLPVGGTVTLGVTLTGTARLLDMLRHYILPVTALSLFYIAVYARLVRGSLIEVSRQDYVRTAIAKGAGPGTILWKHMLRNALLPVTAVAGNNVAAIVSGAVTVETVFDWPGIGRLAFDAVLRRDFGVVMAVLLVSAILVILANILVDLVQAWIDPRTAS